jgi:hypothetical protein
VRALPYAVLVALAGSLGPRLWLPAAVVGLASFSYFELRCRGRWRHPAGWGVALALLILTVLLAPRGPGGLLLPVAGDDLLAAVVTPPPAPTLDAAGRGEALDRVDAALADWAAHEDEASCAAVGEVPGGSGIRETHVSLWLDDERLVRGRSATGRLGEDLCRATFAALDRGEDRPRWAAGGNRVRIQIDLSGPTRRVGGRPVRHAVRWLVGAVAVGDPNRATGVRGLLADAVVEIEPGIDGIELWIDRERGVVLPADPVVRGWLTPRVRGRAEKVERLLIHAARDMRRGPGTWRESGARVLRFRTLAFGRPVPGGPAVELVRGNVPLEEAGADALLAGAGAAADWLVDAARVDGAFDYERFPNLASGSDDYNAVRHAGCVVGLYRMARLAAERPEVGATELYAAAGFQGEAWVMAHLREPEAAPDRRMRAVVFGPRGATAGAAAFAILGILERPESLETDASMRSLDHGRLEGLGRFLQAMIDPDGRVFETWDDARASERVVGEAHPYFPGLVVLSLAELYGATGDQRWLDAAREVADLELARYRSERPTPGHWTIQGYWELYRLTGDEAYARANLELGDHFVAEQYPPHEPPFSDYRGAFHRGDDVPRTIRAASRCEALGAVVDSARALGEDATVYEDALLAAGRHLLENQFRPENRYFLPASERVDGAVRLGLVDNHCRVDGNKHAMLGLVQAWRVARRRAGGAELAPWPETPQRDGP